MNVIKVTLKQQTVAMALYKIKFKSLASSL